MDYKFQGLSEQKLSLQGYYKDYMVPISMSSQRPINRNVGNMNNFNKSGHWSQKQNAKYYAFLEKFKPKFSEKQSRRQWKVFKALSKFIKTRNANQCRSHHHKMNKNFSCIEQTLQSLSKKHPTLKQKSLKYQEQLQKINLGVQQVTFPDAFGKTTHQKKNYIKQFQGCPNYQYDQNDYDKGLFKQTQIGFMKTQATYNLQQAPMDYQNQSYSQRPVNSFRQLPTTGIMSGVPLCYDYPEYSLPYIYHNPFQMNYDNRAQQLQYQRDRLRQQKWMQCHQLFVAWFNKVQSLINQ